MARKSKGDGPKIVVDNTLNFSKYSLMRFNSVREYLARINAEPRSIRTAVVKQTIGKYWRDLAIIRFTKDGIVSCPVESYLPTEREAARMEMELSAAKWPETVKLKKVTNPPKSWELAKEEGRFVFYDDEGMIDMIQVRVEIEGKPRQYVSYTYLNDGYWHALEPEGSLPLWGKHLYAGQDTVFIHEGAKSASAIARLIESGDIDDHPWGRDLASSLHLGWIGGAQNPSRTDWRWLKRKGFKHATIVCDNDRPGREAMLAISRSVDMPCEAIDFGPKFPSGFDMGDPIPEEMFSVTSNGAKVYKGPTLDSLTVGATWLDDVTYGVDEETGRRKKIVELRSHAKDDVYYIRGIDRFIIGKSDLLSPEIFQNTVAPFSSDGKFMRHFLRTDTKFTTKVDYLPEEPHRVVYRGGDRIVNMYKPANVPKIKGDVSPFLDYMEKLIPGKEERESMFKVLATLVAHPEVRSRFATILISNTPGVGKTTLAELAGSLVGRHNYYSMDEKDINSEFNSWAANVRLAYCPEIYQGHDYRTVNRLKSIITDDTISINEKFRIPYQASNRVTIFASSNSINALKLDNNDRRWFVPRVAEVCQSLEYYRAFHTWVAEGGLYYINHWLHEYPEHFPTGSHAPMTDRKLDMVEEGKRPSDFDLENVIGLLLNANEPAGLLDGYISELLGRKARRRGEKSYISRADIRRISVKAGLFEVRGETDEQGRIWDRNVRGYGLVNAKGRDFMASNSGNISLVFQDLSSAGKALISSIDLDNM
jgi:hypothetical protein